MFKPGDRVTVNGTLGKGAGEVVDVEALVRVRLADGRTIRYNEEDLAAGKVKLAAKKRAVKKPVAKKKTSKKR